MLKLWENPMLSIEDRLETASGEIERLHGLLENAANEVERLRGALDRIAESTGSDDPCRKLVQIARDVLTHNAVLRGGEAVPLESTVMQEEP